MAADAIWVVKVNEAAGHMLSTDVEAEFWKKRSIYTVPPIVSDLNRRAYRPQAVSFGPYHHGEEHLKPMEEHKDRALLHFLKRLGEPFELVVMTVSKVLDDLMACYDQLDQKWLDDRNAFLQLMILDGCFMLEILRWGTQTVNDYAPNDPVFSNHGKLYIMPFVQKDMLLLENQLPLLVLDKLVAVETGGSKDEEYVNKLIVRFCNPGMPIMNMGKCLHLLDVFRKSLLLQPKERRSKKRRHRWKTDVARKRGNELIRSAVELIEAGIRFKNSLDWSLKDISFSGRVLRLPLVIVDDMTESMFLNLIAFERFHVGAGNEVTSYVFLLGNIINNEKDVALLQSKGIIQSAFGSEKAVVGLFKSLSKDATLDPESDVGVVYKKVTDYCKEPWNAFRADIIRVYFRNPWVIPSLTIILFVISVIQTMYTILPYYKHSRSGGS